MTQWYVYIVKCADGSLYTGITTDHQRREQEHNECNRLGARYTRARRPVRLVWWQAHEGRAAAASREWAIKKLSRQEKLNLISQQLSGG